MKSASQSMRSRQVQPGTPADAARAVGGVGGRAASGTKNSQSPASKNRTMPGLKVGVLGEKTGGAATKNAVGNPKNAFKAGMPKPGTLMRGKNVNKPPSRPNQ